MTSIEVAYGAIKTRLTNGEWKPGDRMPSIPLLARLCAVSRTTMWRAVGLLQDEHLVAVRARGAIIAGPAGSLPGPAAKTPYPWEELKNRIARDVLVGAIGPGPLPPICKQARHYGVAVDTARKAIAGLVADNVLVREGRRLTPAPAKSLHRNGTLVLISGGNRRAGISIGDTRTAKVVDSFERESSRVNLTAQCEGFDDGSPSALLDMIAAIKSAGHITGCIVNFWQPWKESALTRWHDLLGYLSARKIPTILLDQSGSASFPADITREKPVRILHIAGVTAGERVADSLIGKGHRQAAYLTSVEDAAWSQSRFAGIARRFNLAGSSAATSFGLVDTADTNDLVVAIMGLKEDALYRVFSERLSKREAHAFAARLTKESVGRMQKVFASAAPAKTIKTIAGFMAGLADHAHDREVFDTMLEALIHSAGDMAGRPLLDRLFERVLGESTATAWVCSDDKTAVRAVDFLRKKGRRVPDDIAVFGFENWRESHEGQLSTYDFNMNGLVQEALHLILDPKAFKTKPVSSEVEGYVVERRTTGRYGK